MSERHRLWADVRAALTAGPERVPARRPGRPGRASGPAKHAPQRAPRVPFALLVVTLVAGGLGLLLLLNTASAANEVRRHNLAAQDASIGAELQELQNEVAASAAPGNLAQAAAQLGMVPAGNPAFLVVGADGSVQVLGSPKAVTGAAEAKIPAKTKTSHPPTSPARTSTARSTGHRSSTPASNAHRSSAAAGRTPTGGAGRSTPPATPSTTPTPTVTLPGGNR